MYVYCCCHEFFCFNSKWSPSSQFSWSFEMAWSISTLFSTWSISWSWTKTVSVAVLISFSALTFSPFSFSWRRPKEKQRRAELFGCYTKPHLTNLSKGTWIWNMDTMYLESTSHGTWYLPRKYLKMYHVPRTVHGHIVYLKFHVFVDQGYPVRSPSYLNFKLLLSACASRRYL